MAPDPAEVFSARSTAAGRLLGAAESLFATLFPAECRLCNEPLVRISRLPVCEPCINTIPPPTFPQCCVCGEIVPQLPAFSEETQPELPGMEELLCGLCRRARPSYARAVSVGTYEGALRGLIHLLKYQRVLPAAKAIAELLFVPCRQLVAETGEDCVMVPVPLHGSRSSERGFNQSSLIANLLAKSCGLPCVEVLRRIRPTVSQTGLTRHQRRQNVRGAFAADKSAVTGKKFILFDDVFTTGTTAEECSRVLKRAGALQVWVLTAARVTRTGFAAPGAEQIFNRQEEGSFAARA